MSAPVIDRKIPFLRYLNRIMFGVSLVGILDTVHLLVQEQFGFNKGCLGFVDTAIEQSFNCQQVVSSDAGYLLGLSNTVWGIIFYTAASLLLFLRIAPLKKVNRLLNGVTTGLLSFAFLYTLYLLYYQSFVLGEYCLLCLVSAALAAILFFGEWTRFYYLERYDSSSAEPVDAPHESNEVFWRSIIWIAVVAVAIADMGLAEYQTSKEKMDSTPSSSQIPEKSLHLRDVKSIDLPEGEPLRCAFDTVKTDSLSRELASFYDPTWGFPGSDVSLVFYFDPLNPSAMQVLDMLKSLRNTSRQNLTISFKPIPLSLKSVPAAISLYQAHQQNAFFSYLRALHHPQAKSLPVRQRIQQAAEKTGISIQDARSKTSTDLIKNRLLLEVQKVRSAGLNHFPAILINGKTVDERSFTQNCLQQLAAKAE